MRRTYRLLCFISVLCCAAPALAHPEHADSPLALLLHVLTSPDHVWPLLALVVMGVIGWRVWRSRR